MDEVGVPSQDRPGSPGDLRAPRQPGPLTAGDVDDGRRQVPAVQHDAAGHVRAGAPPPTAMTRVYSTPNAPVAHLVRHALEGDGVAAEVRGETRAAFVGEIPPIEAWVEVWVADADAALAAPTVATFTSDAATPEAWTCACGETLDGSFGTCWSCGADAPDAEPASGTDAA